MVVLVTGSRHWSDEERIRGLLVRLRPSVVIHGGARGADALAGSVARALGIPVRVYPADWKVHGMAAGAIRNSLMLERERVDLVLAFPLKRSAGTWDMVRKAKAAGIETMVIVGIVR